MCFISQRVYIVVSQFHQAQQEKARQAFHEATELQGFLHEQVAERDAKKMAERKEEQELSNRNQKLLEVSQILCILTLSVSYLLCISVGAKPVQRVCRCCDIRGRGSRRHHWGAGEGSAVWRQGPSSRWPPA